MSIAPYWPDWGTGPEPRDACLSCGAEIDHYLGCPDDPDPDYEAEAAAGGHNTWTPAPK